MVCRRLGYSLFPTVKIIALLLSVEVGEPLTEHGVPANEEVGKEQTIKIQQTRVVKNKC